MHGSRGGTGVRTTLKIHKGIGFLSNTGLDPLKNHKATKPAFNVGTSSVSQHNAILMEFSWQANDHPLLVVFQWRFAGRLMMVFGSSLPKSLSEFTFSDKTFWISAC